MFTVGRMLTGSAQPTVVAAPYALRRWGAASSALLALACTTAMLFAPTAQAAPAAGSAGAGSGAWPWPVLGEVITPYINGNDPYAAGQHRGLDIAAPVGEPVLAIVDGRVSFTGRLPDGGLTVTVRGDNGRWLVSNLHLSASTVSAGEHVRAGDLLGRVGTSGRRSAVRPHLHLGVRRAADRAYVDPLTLLGAQRLASAPRESAPRIESLERPQVRQANVRARTTGDSSLATGHGAGQRSVASARSAGDHTREGDAARGTSRVAPPPISIKPEQLARQTRVPAVDTAPPVAASARAATHHDSPPRLLLLAIAAVCLVALVARRKPRNAPPVDHAPPGSESAEVIELRRAG